MGPEADIERTCARAHPSTRHAPANFLEAQREKASSCAFPIPPMTLGTWTMRNAQPSIRSLLKIHPLQGAEVTSSGIAYRSVVNDTFGYPNGQVGRFNSSKRGAWYAGFELETSQAEVVWHLSRDLLEIGRLEDSVAYDDYLADFGGEFYIREDANRGNYLDPHSYSESQALAESHIEQGSSGIIYPAFAMKGAIASSASVPRSSAMFAKARATDLPGQDRSFPASRSKRREPQSSRLSCASNSAVATRRIPSSF